MSLLRRGRVPALLLVAFAVRLYNLIGESLWRDEVDIVRFALAPLDALLRNFPRAGFNGPLYLLLMRGWFALTGVSDFSLRYFSLIFGVLLVALVYTLSRRMLGARPALIAAWLCAIAPVEIWYSGEGKMYTLQPALLVLALYTLLRTVQPQQDPRGDERPHRSKRPVPSAWPITLFLTTTAAFYIHLLSPIVLVVMLAWVLMDVRAARQHWRTLLTLFAALTLPYLPLLIWQAPLFLRGSNTGHTFYALDTMLMALASDWAVGFGQNTPLFFIPSASDLRLAAVLLFVVVAAIGAWQWHSCAPRTVSRLLMWLLLPAAIVWAISLRAPIFQPRYLLWSAPALYILMAAALPMTPAIPPLQLHPVRPVRKLARWVVRVLYGLCSLIAALGIAAQIITPIRPDIRGAAAYIATHQQPGDALVYQIPYGRYAFAYYLSSQLPSQMQTHLTVIEAPSTNNGMGEAEVALTLLHDIGPAPRIWLIETEADLWDNNGLVRAWFDHTLPVVQKADFRGVRLSLHRTSLDKRLYLPNMQR